MDLVTDAIGLGNDEIDEIWCVFDVEWPENHPNLLQAVALAEKHGIRTAISNPCFELWLLLHDKIESAFLTTDAAERESRAIDGRPGKSIDADRYLGQRAVAIERAASLAQRHRGDGTPFPNNNPSSSMGDLVLAIDPKAIQDADDRR